MESSELAQIITRFLQPALPYLLRTSAEKMEEAMTQFGDQGWQHYQMIWGKIQETGIPATDPQKAIQERTASTDDTPLQAELYQQLEVMISQDSSFAAALLRVYDQALQAGMEAVHDHPIAVLIGRHSRSAASDLIKDDFT